MPTTIVFVLLGVVIVSESIPITQSGSSPCPEVFQYVQVSDGEWKANLTLISDSDLHGVWVRLSTKPKLEDVVVSDDYQVKPNGTADIRFSSREDNLKAYIPRSLTVKGKLVDGKTPEVISIILNGKLICTSDQYTGNSLYTGDFNSQNYLSTFQQNSAIQSLPKHNKCGKALLLNSLVPNDNIKVLPGDWPWQAGLFKEFNGNSSLLCEATLISENALLTSAHCVTWKNSNRPIFGTILTARLKNLNVHELNQDDVFKVKNIIIHPDFNEMTLKNDIAIVRLEKSVDINDVTHPICLPESGRLPEESFILGYGFREDGTLTNLGVAKTVPLDDEKCLTLEPSYQSLANDDNYCATYVQGHEVCVGTSGSGVMDVKSDSEFVWELRGILSIGRALQNRFKCDQNSPVLILDVSKYLKWIKANSY